MTPTHRLLSARRVVARERLPEYGQAWERVRRAAAEARVHAWLFRAASPADRSSYMEFLEWSATAGDARLEPALARALEELEQAFPGTLERWDEVAPPYFPEEERP